MKTHLRPSRRPIVAASRYFLEGLARQALRAPVGRVNKPAVVSLCRALGIRPAFHLRGSA
jgi:hypothetical protein